MTTVFDERGLRLERFDPVLADLLGGPPGEAGANVLLQTQLHGRPRVELRDWLYCLASTPGTIARATFVDAEGRTPERFVRAIEGGFATDPASGLPPETLRPDTVSPDVATMLQSADRLTREAGRERIDEAPLLLALLQSASPDLRRMLVLWSTAEGLEKLEGRLRKRLRRSSGREPFDAEGALDWRVFTPAGRRLLQRVLEDAASLGAERVTTRHLVYTLLSDEGGPVPAALAQQGFDVKHDLHARLAVELGRVGRKRTDDLPARKDRFFDPVLAVFDAARRAAEDDDEDLIGARHLHRGFVKERLTELLRVLPTDPPFDRQSFVDYVELAQPADESLEVEHARLTVRAIEARLRETIFGQGQAIGRVIPWIKRLRFGLPRENRPAAVFLFLGPTGTGKTQLAKELARYVYGGDDELLFVEMTHFKTRESMSGLIGAPPGYVGYGEGLLTNGLRDRPECVVLFDEVEKADAEVLDVILRFADEGLISDPAGPVRDGRRCIIVITTNAGQRWLRSHLRARPEAREDAQTLAADLFDAAMEELAQRGMRPEFLGRIDECVTFLPLDLDTCRRIVRRTIEAEVERFRAVKRITLEVDDRAAELMAENLASRASDEGARAASRVVNEFVVTPVIDVLVDADADEASARPASRVSVRGADGSVSIEVS